MVMTTEPPETQQPLRPSHVWEVPREMEVPPDTLRLRLDFFHQACIMTNFDGDAVESKPVDAMDVAHALAHELTYGTGFLPLNSLWWENTRAGPITAIYTEPRARTLAVQLDLERPVRRYTIPVPPLVFLCLPGRPPWLYAVKARPTKDEDPIYHAPFLNVFANGRSCTGSHEYPQQAGEIPESFFISFFTHILDHRANVADRSQKHPKDVLDMWKELEGKRHYPLSDLVQCGTIKDLRMMEKAL